MQLRSGFAGLMRRTVFLARAMLVFIVVVIAGSPAIRADEPEKLPPISERARQVHAAGMLFDGHNDLPWRLRAEE